MLIIFREFRWKNSEYEQHLIHLKKSSYCNNELKTHRHPWSIHPPIIITSQKKTTQKPKIKFAFHLSIFIPLDSLSHKIFFLVEKFNISDSSIA